MNKRSLDIVILSDLHLGNAACHASDLLTYLKSIDPKLLILNGDIVDHWVTTKEPASAIHREVFTHILRMGRKGKKIYYLMGNHDRDDSNPLIDSSIIIRNHLELVVDHKKYWIFHGDIFDASLTISPIFASLGLYGYRKLVRINQFIGFLRSNLGMSRLSLAALVKKRFGKALKYVAEFESLACKHARMNEYDVVICGHIHVPVIKTDLEYNIKYMNAGDWVENLTALEYQNGRWSIHTFDPADYTPVSKRLQVSRKATSRRDVLNVKYDRNKDYSQV